MIDQTVTRIQVGIYALLVVLVLTPRVWAIDVPTPVEPGVIENELKTSPEPRSSHKILVAQPTAGEIPKNIETVSFVLQGVVVGESSVYSAEQLAPLYANLIGTTITLADVYAIANAITQKYSDDGFALSIGYVPAQEIESGQVRIGIAEGYVTDLEIRGDRYPERLVQAYADKMLQSRPLRTADLERFLLLTNDIPGVSAKSTFARTEGPVGSTRLVVDVTQDSFGGALALNNRGSKALGRERGALHLEANSPFGGGEQFSLDYVQAFDRKEMNFVGIGVKKPVGAQGTVLGLQAGVSDAEPGTALLESLEFASEGRSGSLFVTHPFIRTRSRNLSATAELEIKNLSSDILGTLNSEDHMRVLRVGVDFDWLDRFGGISLAGITLSQGLDIFDATQDSSPTKSRADGTFDFTKATLRFYRLQDLPGPFDGVLSVDAQRAFDTLPSSEMCGYGGAQYGRGFDGYQLAGDHCLKGSLELRWYLPNTNRAQIYGFFDAGKVWKEGDPLPGEYDSKEATSAGLGLRFGLGERANLSFEYAQPYKEDVSLEGNRDARVFASIGIGF